MRDKELELIDKLWAHYTSRLLQARKDFRYAWNRRNEECRVNWEDTLPARISDIKMWEMAIQRCGIGWEKYNLNDPMVASRTYDNGKDQ